MTEELDENFGNLDPKKMPMHFFFGTLHMDYSTAIRANVALQDFSVCPRHWYVDAVFPCESCKNKFTWSAAEQRAWFEEYRFYVDSRPKLCLKCRRRSRHMKHLRKEYDRLLASARTGFDEELKKQVIALVDQLEESLERVPEKMRSARTLLKKQIKKAELSASEDSKQGFP